MYNMKKWNWMAITENLIAKGIDKAEILLHGDNYKSLKRRKKRWRKKYIKERLDRLNLDMTKPEIRHFVKLYKNKEEEQYMELLGSKIKKLRLMELADQKAFRAKEKEQHPERFR